MPDSKENLYLFEAIVLRNEYDRYTKLLEKLIEGEQKNTDKFFSRGDEEERESASDFSQQELEEELGKLKTRRVKLNQAIQTANFKYQIDYEGEKISIAEALEIRKNLLADTETISQRVINSAYKRIIHKEERDIVHEPKHSFKQVYDIFRDNIKKLRAIVIQIHNVNFISVVNFREE
jgi:lysyl-tRNA synthetase class I